MAVYVDMLVNYGWKLGPSCHLIADTEEELHNMAIKIGMKRSWFQNSSLAHYDLVASKRALAIKHGAIELNSWREAAAKIIELRKLKQTI